jgi:carboxylesterase
MEGPLERVRGDPSVCLTLCSPSCLVATHEAPKRYNSKGTDYSQAIEGKVTMTLTAPSISSAPRKPVVGALLVHGLNGSKYDMQEIHELLLDRGIHSRNILLPGHGTQVRDMLPLGWPEWSQAVSAEVRQLKEQCDQVFLIGHSLGGSLCLHTAAHDEVAGVITMCAPLYMQPWLPYVIRFTSCITPLLPTLREDVRDPKARRRYTRNVYRWTPMAPVASMLQYLPHLRDELPRITAPALIMVSTHDHVVPARDGHAIYHSIGSKEKHLVTLHRSYHVIMKDHDRDEVFAKTLAFIQRHSARAAAQTVGA